MRIKTKTLLDKLKLFLDPDTLLYTLKVGQQQVVEIAKALLVDADVIIMDEPTSAISESEAEVLFKIIDDLKRDNKAVVYISHKLDELFKIADRYIVLRDGKMIDAGEIEGITQDDIIQKMIGREISMMHKKKPDSNTTEVLSIENLSLRHAIKKQENFLKNISFKLNEGEIVGIIGLMGAGRQSCLKQYLVCIQKHLQVKLKLNNWRCTLKLLPMQYMPGLL